MYVIRVVIVSLHLVLLQAQSDEVLPTSFTFNSDEATSINGSSPSGQCSSICAAAGVTSNCTAPASSVLFDGHTPILTRLDRDMWASDMLTFQTRISTQITFDFMATGNFTGVERVEVVLFNCPEWGIAVDQITLLAAASITSSRSSALAFFTIHNSSCYSPVQLCIRRRTELPVVTLRFRTPQSASWVHLAKVQFYSNGPCEFEEEIVHTPVSPETTMHTTEATPCNCPSSKEDCQFTVFSTSGIITTAVTAGATAVLATIIFVLIQTAICLCCQRKATPKGVEPRSLRVVTEEEEEHVYDQVADGSRSLRLKENEAYVTGKKMSPERN